MKIVIDGNIASGKTTQLNLLEQQNFKVKREPIEDWPLELYYGNPEQWGLFFQLIVLKTHSRIVKDESCIYERFPGSGTQVFWPIMKKNPSEDLVYQEAYRRYGWEPDIFIWIHTSPSKCWNNVQTRNQDGDKSITSTYLDTLDTQYEKMFNSLKCLKFEINGNDTVEQVHNEILKIINNYY